jgi:hypothetical protein
MPVTRVMASSAKSAGLGDFRDHLKLVPLAYTVNEVCESSAYERLFIGVWHP